MTPPRRRLAVAAATLTLAALVTGCGAVGQAVDCSTATTEINKISSEFSSSLSSAATDPKALETSSQEAADKLKALAGKYDGDLASAINDLAGIFEGVKADDPSAAQSAMTKVPEMTAKITAACG